MFAANPPDVLVYMSCPDADLRAYRDGLTLESAEHNRPTQTLHLSDADDFRARNVRHVRWYGRDGVVAAADDHADEYAHAVDAVIKRFDPGRVITVDGRRPVAGLFETVRARLVSMPLQRTVVPVPLARDRDDGGSAAGVGGSADGEESGPAGGESDGDEEGPAGGESVGEELGSAGGESDGDEEESAGGEWVGEELGSAGGESVGEESGSAGDESGSVGGESVGEESVSAGGESERRDEAERGDDGVRRLSAFGRLCPVSLGRGSYRTGDEQHRAEFAGQLYLFAGPEELRSFVERPRRYLDVPRPAVPVRAVFYGPRELSGPAAAAVRRLYGHVVVDADRVIRAHRDCAKRAYASAVVRSVLETARRVTSARDGAPRDVVVARTAIRDWTRLYFGAEADGRDEDDDDGDGEEGERETFEDDYSDDGDCNIMLARYRVFS